MKFRVVRLPGETRYVVQWSTCLGLIRGYERDFSIFCPPMRGCPRLYFPTHSEAQEYIYRCLEEQRGRGAKWPWQPTSYY